MHKLYKCVSIIPVYVHVYHVTASENVAIHEFSWFYSENCERLHAVNQNLYCYLEKPHTYTYVRLWSEIFQEVCSQHYLIFIYPDMYHNENKPTQYR